MSNRPPQLLGDTKLTRAEELFVRQVSARYVGMENWQIAYVVRKMLDLLEVKRRQTRLAAQRQHKTKKKKSQMATNARNLAFVDRQKAKGLIRFNRWVTPEESEFLKATYDNLVAKREGSS